MTPRSIAAELQSQGHALLETGDYDLLDQPYRTLADVREIEKTPLDKRLVVDNFSQRTDIAMRSRKPHDVAIHYVADGDVHAPAQEVTFRTLLENIDRTAAVLRVGNDEPNAVTAVLMPAVPSIYWAVLGAMQAGIVFPVNWMLNAHYTVQLLREAGVTRIIALGPTTGFSIWESLMSVVHDLLPGTRIWSVAGPGGQVLPETDLDLQIARQPKTGSRPPWKAGHEIAAYVHSGGTTGMPKIVKLSHLNLSFRHWTLQWAFRAVPGEVILHDTPLFHVGGLTGRCLPPVASGASVLIPSILGARDKQYLKNYWKFVAKYRVTRLSGVPTTLAVLAKSPPQGDDLSSLKPCFITGSTAMPVALREEFERISGVRVLNSYGMTENTASMAIDPRDGVPKIGSSGIRLPYTDLRAAVSDGQGRTIRVCGPDEIGMLQVRSPGLTPGYVNPAHEIAARTDDGWFVTGDLGRVDADGYVFVTGRAKDVIIRGGHNIDPALIEEPLVQCPDVLLAAAVGKPDAHAGELPIAYVQLNPGSRATSKDLLTFLEGRIPERAAVPKEIHILERLPLTDIGKPLKTQLRLDAAERAFRAVVEEATGLDSQGAHARFTVRVQPHPTHGTLVSIAVPGASRSEQQTLGPVIHEAMSKFAYVFAIDWQA